MKDFDLNQLAAEQEMNEFDSNSLQPDDAMESYEFDLNQPVSTPVYSTSDRLHHLASKNSAIDLNQPTSPRVVHISDGLDGPTSNSSVINLNESVSAGFSHNSEEIRSMSEDYLPDLEQTFDDDVYLNLDRQQNQPGIFEINMNEPETERDAIDNTLLENIRPRSKKKNLTLEIKRAIVAALLEQSINGRLLKGALSNVANSFSICTRSVSRMWHEAKDLRNTNGENLLEFRSKLTNRVGRKRIQVDIERVKQIPVSRRTNIRSLSMAINASKSTMHRRIKDGNIRPHSNACKPYLTDDNKKVRLQFCMSMVDTGTIATKPTFVNMYNRIHIDEKWFYITKTTNKYYLHPEEPEPYRTCKSKRYITKIMFLAAVARPRTDANNNAHFNGKIGIWPLVFKETARRNSKNRAVGTMETKPILSVTKDVIRTCLIEKVLPAIKQKWPASSSEIIFIQQDNAKPHLDTNDPEFVMAANGDGFEIRLCCQPPNSPDLNVLDLGFFSSH